ncbi:MAG: DUF115 domain-containing protein [bacterium]|nr:DUF115 domain-containing protein [bacterium]
MPGMMREGWRLDLSVLPHPLEAAGVDWCFRLPDGRLGCSGRDPRREAARRCAHLPPGSRPVLLGLGAGHDLDALLEGEAGELLVVEADPRSLATTLERWRLLGRTPPDPARCRLVLADDDGSLCRLLAELLRDEHGERPLILHPWCAELWRAATPEAARLMEDLRRRRSAAHSQEELLAANRTANAARLEEARWVAELDGAWGNDPVLVCGAGPGLGPALKRLDDAPGLRIIAVSTALPALALRGIRPDVVVATDPSPLLAQDIVAEELSLGDVPLAVFPTTSAALVEAWPGPLWLATPEGPGPSVEKRLGRCPGSLPAGCGTVAGPALGLGARLSGGVLLMAGVDLWADGPCYTDGVRRPKGPKPDFAFARRRMAELVRDLRRQGRRVGVLGHRPDWLPVEGSGSRGTT